MFASDIPITPNVGWANIQLGATLQEVRAALATNGHAYDLSDDGYSIDIHVPETTFYFDDSNPKKLVQFVFYNKDHRVDDQPVIGLPLDEAMLPFHVKSFHDTLWSLVSIEEEYPKGIPLHDSKRITKYTAEKKLQHATLWLNNKGVGLVMLFGIVHAMAIRRAGEEPKVGCGQLDATTMALASQVMPKVDMKEAPSSKNYKSKPQRKRSWILRSALTLLAVIFLAIPGWIVYRDLTAWQKSIAVTGKVVETKPAGPFPEEIMVQYSIPNAGEHIVSIPSTYTSAWEIEAEVELLYLPNRPDRAMSRLQARDEGFSVSPYFLFGSLGLATFFLSMAFPNHIRLRSRYAGN